MAGERPPPREPDECDPGSQRSGWQHEAVSRVERSFCDAVFRVQVFRFGSKCAHLRDPALQTPPKFHEKTPREGRKKIVAGE